MSEPTPTEPTDPEPTPEPTPDPEPTPEPEPDPTPTPEPDPTPDPEPTPDLEPTQPGSTVPVPVPPGTATGGSIKQMIIRRMTPAFPAVCYDGTNAVQVAGWLIGRGQPCNLSMQPGTPPILVDPEGTPVRRGWVLPNLEVVTDQEMDVLYEQVVVPQ